MIKIKTFLVCALALLVSSCCKEECEPGLLFINYQNFTTGQTDTIAYIKYNPGTNLAQAIDTTWDYHAVANSTDTTHSYLSRELYYAWDWKIYVPALSKTYSITNFQTGVQKCHCGGGKTTVVRGFTVNGAHKEGSYLVLDK
jgi:hypothetical protein